MARRAASSLCWCAPRDERREVGLDSPVPRPYLTPNPRPPSQGTFAGCSTQAVVKLSRPPIPVGDPDALSRAVVAVDDEFCRHRWVSLVRDNGKKFYITRAEEVGADFNIHQWDT